MPKNKTNTDVEKQTKTNENENIEKNNDLNKDLENKINDREHEKAKNSEETQVKSDELKKEVIKKEKVADKLKKIKKFNFFQKRNAEEKKSNNLKTQKVAPQPQVNVKDENNKTQVQNTQINININKNQKVLSEEEIFKSARENKKIGNRKFTNVEDVPSFDKGIKGLKQKQKFQQQLTSKYSKRILTDDEIVSTQDYVPNVEKHVIELKNIRKSYQTGDLETPILKGIDVQLERGDFIVILGPSGSGKTTFLNIISGLDKATEGDVFILGSNLSLLKDSHLTKFRRKNIGFIFQQYNLLTNLTSKENAEVGQNLADKKKIGMSIEEIFETIGMKEQMNKYPHQMSGGQQQRVSIARALAKNPEILFADEPTGALDEEMGRKVLEILVKVNREQKTTIIVVTHNPNIAKIANTVIHIKNGLIDNLERNPNPADPQDIDWS